MTVARPVFFFGALPPPVHGMAVVNAQMVGLISAHAPVVVANISPDSLQRGLAYHVRKTCRILASMFLLIKAKVSGARNVYGAVDDNWGGIWTILILASARILQMRIFLHHHSFRYLIEPTAIMSALTWVAGTAATHIVLGERMAERLTAHYRSVKKVVVCANSVAVSKPASATPQRQGVVIGLMSNLTAEKGLFAFLDIVEHACARDIAIKAVLAGPVPDAAAQRVLDDVIERHSSVIDYRGPVAGDAKEKFFADIDLFLFPTFYRTEAYPLVLIESVVRGVGIVAFDRGCIGDLAGLDGVTIVPVDHDFTAQALDRITGFELDNRATRRAQIAQSGRALNDINLTKLEKLAHQIAGVDKDAI